LGVFPFSIRYCIMYNNGLPISADVSKELAVTTDEVFGTETASKRSSTLMVHVASAIPSP